MSTLTPQSVAAAILASAASIHNQAGYANIGHSHQRKFQEETEKLRALAGDLDKLESWPDDGQHVHIEGQLYDERAYADGNADSPPVSGESGSGTLQPGEKPKEEVGGIPSEQSADPQVNITPVGTIPAPADPQIPALITPPGEPMPEPAVVVVKEGDSPMETVNPDGTLEQPAEEPGKPEGE